MAIIYDKDISKGVNLNQTQFENLNLKPSNMCGFILSEDLKKILNLPGCVGIRFYNIISLNFNDLGEGHGKHHYLIACGVDSEGYEIKNDENNEDSEASDKVIYITNPVFGEIRERISPINHSEAVLKVNSGSFGEGKRQILAFFSKSDLEGILLSSPGIPDGITLYLVQYENQGEIEFNDDHLDEFKALETFATMIAFRTKFVDNDLPMEPDLERNIMSLYPCPGHCVWTNHDTQDRHENKLAIQPNVDMERRPNPNDPYLFDWTKNKEEAGIGLGGIWWLSEGLNT